MALRTATPARTLGGVLMFLGVFISANGLWGVSKGEQPYFAIAGLGMLLTGLLLAFALKFALVTHALTFGIALVGYFAYNTGSVVLRRDYATVFITLGVSAIHLARPAFRSLLR